MYHLQNLLRLGDGARLRETQVPRCRPELFVGARERCRPGLEQLGLLLELSSSRAVDANRAIRGCAMRQRRDLLRGGKSLLFGPAVPRTGAPPARHESA